MSSPSLSLLERDPISQDLIDSLIKSKDDEAGARRVRCPLCFWEPGPSSRWTCVDHEHPEYFRGGCGTTWNTFETGGRCPGCDHSWQWTACLQCSGWSLHENWYVTEDEGR